MKKDEYQVLPKYLIILNKQYGFDNGQFYIAFKSITEEYFEATGRFLK